MMAIMRILFYGGMILIAMGLLAAAVETGAHGLPGAGRGFFMSAFDLWYTMRPKSLLLFEIRIERLVPWLWDPVLTTVLKLPAWAIFGVPGGAIVWFCHPGRGVPTDDGVNEVLDSFELFDELTRRARRENPKGEEHGPRDMLPDDLIEQDLAPDANAPGDFNEGANPFDAGNDTGNGKS